MACSLTLPDQTLHLLPERAVYWPAEGMLVIADVHLGKAAAFRAGGIPVPTGTTQDDLARLTAALQRTGARQMLILGDLLHAKSGRAPGTLELFTAWRAAHADLKITLIPGNHDHAAGPPPLEWCCEIHPDPLVVGPFIFAHAPEDLASVRGSRLTVHGKSENTSSHVQPLYALCGHVHPGVNLRFGHRGRARLPCFNFGARVALLPAFGAFTGLFEVEPEQGDRVFAVCPDGVVVETPNPNTPPPQVEALPSVVL